MCQKNCQDQFTDQHVKKTAFHAKATPASKMIKNHALLIDNEWLDYRLWRSVERPQYLSENRISDILVSILLKDFWTCRSMAIYLFRDYIKEKSTWKEPSFLDDRVIMHDALSRDSKAYIEAIRKRRSADCYASVWFCVKSHGNCVSVLLLWRMCFIKLYTWSIPRFRLWQFYAVNWLFSSNQYIDRILNWKMIPLPCLISPYLPKKCPIFRFN